MKIVKQQRLEFEEIGEGIEIIGSDLPNGWNWVRLGDLVDNPMQDLVDGPFGSNLKAEEYIECGIPVFKIQNIKANKFLNKKLSYISEEKAKLLNRHSFQAGDLIITKLGEPLGLCCKVPEQYPYGIIVADLMRLRPSKSKVTKEFLVYVINSNVVQNQFKVITKGTTRARVNLTIVRDIKVPLPSLSEQQKIVAKIEELLSELDKGKEQLETARQQLKVYRQAVLKWAFEGKLTNSEIKEGELPEGWKIVRPTDVALKEKYSLGIGPFGSNLKTSDYTTQGAPLIFVKNITRNNFDLDKRFISKRKFNELYAHQVKPRDILITKMGDPPGDCTIYPLNKEEAVLTADCLKLRVDNEVASTEFIKYVLQSKGVKRQIEAVTIGVAQKKISVERFKSIEIPLPTLEEQKRIVQEIESRLSVCDKVEGTIGQSLKQVEILRQSILKKAFEGRIIN